MQSMFTVLSGYGTDHSPWQVTVVARVVAAMFTCHHRARSTLTCTLSINFMLKIDDLVKWCRRSYDHDVSLRVPRMHNCTNKGNSECSGLLPCFDLEYRGYASTRQWYIAWVATNGLKLNPIMLCILHAVSWNSINMYIEETAWDPAMLVTWTWVFKLRWAFQPPVCQRSCGNVRHPNSIVCRSRELDSWWILFRVAWRFPQTKGSWDFQGSTPDCQLREGYHGLQQHPCRVLMQKLNLVLTACSL